MENVLITPTNDLDKLEQDIQAWYRLPFNLRMRSNDECIRQYGMTTLDLYNSIKSRILSAKSKEETDSNNIVMVGESFEFGDIDPYLLAKSKEIQSSPYIVILDPDIISKAELDDKFNMFNSLNSKNRRLSNDFSLNLWGYNVYNMYDILLNRIEQEDPDKNNIVRLEDINESARIESVIKPLYDLYNSAMVHHDEFDKAIVKANILETVDDDNITAYSMLQEFASFTLDPDDAAFDESILPKYIPYLLPDECNECLPRSAVKDYYKGLTESKAIDRMKYYWNPFVPIEEKSLALARSRYSRYFNNTNIIDLRGMLNYFKESYECDLINKNIYPVYLIFDYDKERSVFNNDIDYNKVGISLEDDFKIIYTIKGKEDTFSGFELENYSNYNNVTVVVIFVSERVKVFLKDVLTKAYEKLIIIEPVITPYSVILSKLQNKFSPDAAKIIYRQYADFVCKLCNIDDPGHEIKHCNVYKLYEGPATGLKEDIDSIQQLIGIILSSITSDKIIENFREDYENSMGMYDIKNFLDIDFLRSIK